MQSTHHVVPYNWIEIAIVAKWTLHEAWLQCLDLLDQRLQQQRLTIDEKFKMEELYNTLFYQSFYSVLKTRSDVDDLLKNTRIMLGLLKKLDQKAWHDLLTPVTADY